MAIQEISGGRDHQNTLRIHDNQTSSPAVWIGNNGWGAGLYVENKGLGNIAYFQGNQDSKSHGVVINNIGGNNNALNIRNIHTNHPAVWIGNNGWGAGLYVENKGLGNIAYFQGNQDSQSHGVVINNIGGNNNALNIHNIHTNNSAVYIENSGSGNSLFVNNKGSGYSIQARGDIYVEGRLQEASSIELKENVKDLHYQDAIDALKALNPVKYNYKSDTNKKDYLGFIAEEVPDLVASDDRKKLSSMDIIAVLTKVIQEQQKTIFSLAERVKDLEKKE